MESMRLSFLYTAGCSLLILLCFGSMLLLPVLHPDYRGKQPRLLLLQKARYFLFYSIINLLVFLCSQPVFTALGLYSQWYPLILLPVLVSFPAAVLVFGWAIERKNCCSVKELFSLSLLCFATVLLFWECLFLRTASADTFAENFIAALILSVFHTLLFFEVCFASKIASRFLQNRRG